jgi:hypothetical protein
LLHVAFASCAVVVAVAAADSLDLRVYTRGRRTEGSPSSPAEEDEEEEEEEEEEAGEEAEEDDSDAH